MKHNSSKKTTYILPIGIIVAMFGFMQGAHASEDHDNACTNAILKGAFGFSQLGSVVNGTTVLPAGDVGIISSDGNGNLTGSETVNVAGHLFNDTFTDGTYQINPDCTGTATWTAIFSNGRPSQIRTASLVVTKSGQEIQILSTGAGAVLVGTATKQ